MNIFIDLYIGEEKIGTMNHQYLFDDEANSGREICKGCLVILHDFKYRVESVKETSIGYEAHLLLSNE
jgi:hypothetical protein